MTRDDAIKKAISARSDTATKLRLCGDENGDDLTGDEILKRAYAAFHTSLAASGFAVVAVGGPMRLEFASPHGTTTIDLDADAWAHVVAAAQEDSHE